MIAAATRYGIWSAGLSDGCDRLVHPSVPAGEERARQRRFIGAALAAPFAAGAATVLLMSGSGGIAAMLAAVCAIFAVSWSIALLAALTGRRELAEPAALAAGALFIATAVAGTGGAASPALALALCLVAEAFWIGRGRTALIAGAAAAVAVVPLQALIGATAFSGVETVASPWHWLLALAYAGAAWPRLAAMAEHGDPKPAPDLEWTAGMLGGAALKLSASGEVLEASGRTVELLGAGPELLAGRPLVERIHVADRVALMCALADLREGKKRVTVEARARVPAGDGEPGERHANVLFELASIPGDSKGVVALLLDNEETAALKAMLAAAADKADSIEVAKSRFLGAVSHELRTPLNAIIGFSDMLIHNMAGEFADVRQRDYVGLIRESGEHLLSVVNAILDVSKIEAGAYPIRPEPFMMKQAVELCRSMMAHLAEAKGLAFSAHVRPQVGEICADSRAVRQIIINLVSNAIKFTPAGGSVNVEVLRHGSRVDIVVNDNGIGIAEGDLDRLGQPFTQISNDMTRQYEGTGLGLSLVKGLVRLHEGEMTIESAPGQGTSVRVSLPVAGPRFAAVPASEPEDARPMALVEKGGSDEAVRRRA